MTELSGLEVAVLAKEIGKALSGTYVAGVYSLGENQILKFKRPEGEDAWLVASPRYGAWVSRKVAEKAETTEFTSRLRGEVERLRFAGSGQLDMDRVFDLTLGGGDDQKRMLVELMPPGNLVVVDRSDRLRLLLREVRSDRRRLVRGGTYSPPPQSRRSPAELTAAEVEAMLRGEKTVGRALGRGVSLPRKYVREALVRLGVDEGGASSELMGRTGEVVSTMAGMVEEAMSSPSPAVCETPEGDEMFVIRPTNLKVKVRSDSLCELCDEFFLPLLSKEIGMELEPRESKRRELEATLVKLAHQEKQARETASRLREAARSAMHASTEQEALSILQSAGIKTLRRTLASKEAVSSLIYARAKELEGAADDARAAAARLGRRAEKVPTQKPMTKRISRRSVSWFEKFRWFYTSDGKLAVGGRDAQSNELLVKRHLDDDDTVYHADLFGSPFFVLKGGRSQTEQEIQEVAQATVSFSSAWKTGLGSADAYWIFKDQVSSSAPTGEYLPRGSFLIRGKKNMIGRNLVQVSIGIDSAGRIVCGPESALEKAASCYVILTPHREKPSETAKKVARELTRLSGASGTPHIDDILRALPAGGGKILRAKSSNSQMAKTTANL